MSVPIFGLAFGLARLLPQDDFARPQQTMSGSPGWDPATKTDVGRADVVDKLLCVCYSDISA